MNAEMLSACAIRRKEVINNKANDEPLKLLALSKELIFGIFNKLEYDQLIKFHKTSKLTRALVEESGTRRPVWFYGIFVSKKRVTLSKSFPDTYECADRRIPWHVVIQSPVRINASMIYILHRASGRRLQAVAKLLKETKTECNTLVLTEYITFEPEDMGVLLEAADIKIADSHQFVPRKFFKSMIFNRLNNAYFPHCGITDEELPNWKLENFTIKSEYVTATGLNHFLRQWKNEERELNYCKFSFDTTAGSRNFNTIIDGINANPIWTPDLHEYSLIGVIPFEEIGEIMSNDPSHCYVLWCSSNINKRISIFIRHKDVVVRRCDETEKFWLHSLLDSDQLYTVTNQCQWCERQFCDHHRWYSCQRFKRAYPLLYHGIYNAVKNSRIGVEFLHYTNYLLGNPLPVHQMNNEELRRLFDRDAGDSSFWRQIVQFRVMLFNC